MLHETKGYWYADANPDVTSNDYLYAVTLLPSGQEGWAVGSRPTDSASPLWRLELSSHQASSKLPQ